MKGTGGFLQPEGVLEQLNIKKDIIAADFGCGAGYFTLPLAKKVDKVYALDVLDTALESVRSQAKLQGLLNIETKQADLEVSSGLENESIDLVLLANILFQSDKRGDIIKEAEKVLKKGGQLVIIDWKKNQPMGPPQNLVVLPESIKTTLKLVKEFPVDKYHWGLIFEK